MPQLPVVAIALTGALIGACAPVKGPRMWVQEFPTISRVACSGLCQDSVTIRYLGVAGFVVRHGSHTLLTGPSFTNPPFHASVFAAFPFTRWMLGTLRPDTTLVDRLLVPDTANIDALLIGHGHYDHALDAPRVLARYGAGAMLVGGRTAINMLLGDPAIRDTPGHLITIVDPVAATASSAGQWIYSPSGAFRILAIAADHAPTVKVGLFEWLFANGEVNAPRAHLPRTTADWRAGESYSYLIDVLVAGSRDSVALRIYFQDAPNRPPLGFPPAAIIGGRPVDVAILCVATAGNVAHSPDSLLKAMPARIVIAAHWESFFAPQTEPIQANRFTNLTGFERAVRTALPDLSLYVRPQPQDRVVVGVPLGNPGAPRQ